MDNLRVSTRFARIALVALLVLAPGEHCQAQKAAVADARAVAGSVERPRCGEASSSRGVAGVVRSGPDQGDDHPGRRAADGFRTWASVMRRRSRSAISDRRPKVALANIRPPSRINRRSVRRAAVFALGNLGTAARSAVPELVVALGDSNETVRHAAAYALGSVGEEAKAGAAALGKVLTSDADPDVRQAAAFALGEIGSDAAEAVPALTQALADSDEAVRKSVIEALGSMGPEAKPAVEALAKIVTDDSDFVLRRSAAFVLGEMGPEARGAAVALGKALKDSDASVRYDAAQSLSVLGPDAKAALPALIEALAEEDVEVLKKVIYTLGEMGPSADPAAHVAGQVHESRRRRRSQGRRLRPGGDGARRQKRGPRAHQGPARQGDERPPRRGLCHRRAGSRSSPARLTALIQAIRDPDDDVREEIVFAIGEIGTDAPPVIAALQQALQDPSPTVRGAAQEAIDKLQGDDDDDDDPQERQHARQEASKILEGP